MSETPSYSERFRVSWAFARTRQTAASHPRVWGSTWKAM